MISFLAPNTPNGDDPASIDLSILAPTDFAAPVFTLLKAAMGNPEYRFVIIVDFYGLSVDEAPPNPIPSAAEFFHPDLLRSKPYFADKITVSICTFPLTSD
jgi:hypothetical protein